MRNTEEYNILFTSVGRRVSLIRHFQKTLKDLQLPGKVIGVDVSEKSPAFHIVDKAYTICEIDDKAYIPSLLDICKKENIKLLFPLIDTDLMKLSKSRQAFEAVGTNAVISETNVIEIASNKYKTYGFFVSNNIDTPKVFNLDLALESDDLQFPLFIKPLDGNASKGTFTVRNRDELDFFSNYVQRPILQEYVSGTEHTLDILFDFQGQVRCVVPRKRLEVRAGEVSKGQTVDDATVLDAGWHVGDLLKGGRGCVNVQCFLTNDGRVKFVEINPRFGGGTPLALQAGADFPRWIIQMARGEDPGDISRAFQKDLIMLRYDDAVFVEPGRTNEEDMMVFGAGGHGKVVIDAIEQEGQHRIAYVLDDNVPQDYFFKYPVPGGMETVKDVFDKGIKKAIVSVGDGSVRSKYGAMLEEIGFNLITVKHPTAVVSSNVNIGGGTVVFADAIVNSGTHIGKNCIINTGALIEHDNVIGENVHISPKAVLGGDVRVGDNSHIGIGATIINSITIGKNTIIGAGAVVTKDIPDDVVAYGIPARVIRPNKS